MPTPKYRIGDIVLVDINAIAEYLESFKPYGLMQDTDKDWKRLQTIAVQLKITRADCCDFTIGSDLFKEIESDEYDPHEAQWMYGFEYEGADNLEMLGEDQIIGKI